MRREKGSCELLALHQLLGRKWTVPLLGEMEQGPCSFNQLKRKTANQINATLLSRTLQDLVKHNIIHPQTIKTQTIKNKEESKETKATSLTTPTVVSRYELTSAGQSLMQQLLSLKQWATQHRSTLPENCTSSSCLTCGHFLTPRCHPSKMGLANRWS